MDLPLTTAQQTPAKRYASQLGSLTAEAQDRIARLYDHPEQEPSYETPVVLQQASREDFRLTPELRDHLEGLAESGARAKKSDRIALH